MDWENLGTTEIYAKVHQEHLRSVIGRLSPLLRGQVASDASLESVTRGAQAGTPLQKLLDSGANLEIGGH